MGRLSSMSASSQIFPLTSEVPRAYAGAKPSLRGYFREQRVSSLSTIFQFHGPSMGVIGQGCISRKPISYFRDSLRPLIQRTFQNVEPWVCENIFFAIPDSSSIHESLESFDTLCTQFYEGLLQTMSNFAKKNKLNQVLCLNDTQEHEDLILFGGWYFSYEMTFFDEKESKEKILSVFDLEKHTLV